MAIRKTFYIILFIISAINVAAQKTITTDVLIVGGGTGGTAAALQAARLGVKVIIAESTTWLGGMLSAAGVGAVDGNHKLPSGIWAEFREKIYQTYGGPKAVETGWVSNTLFEPHVADSIFKVMVAAEKNITVNYQYNFEKAIVKNNKVIAVIFSNATNEKIIINAKIIVDATELGDVLASAKVPYSLGLEASLVTKENVGVPASSNIIQDITYVAILKDYGTGADKTITKPANYNPNEFDAACTDYYINKKLKAPNVDAKKMLDYGRLPKNKFMLNWPNQGNDTYLNLVQMTTAKRNIEIEKAKQTTLRFVYFIQQQLGFKNLGLATDEFPTKDNLALIPYHRESRRVKGLVRFNVNHIAKPFDSNLYRTGVSVGDYPIDHHHKKNTDAPQNLDFFPIPSYNMPLGVVIPNTMDGLLVAEKNISVSNVVNGTTRLQPVILLTGQAVGVLAALAIKENKQPRNIAVRKVQNVLLQNKAYIMPYIDVLPTHPQFEAIQKIGATGILKGTGIPYKWANQTWFYPDSTILTKVFLSDVKPYLQLNIKVANDTITLKNLFNIIAALTTKTTDVVDFKNAWQEVGLTNFDETRAAKRFEIAAIIDRMVDPFNFRPINHLGNFIN
jgi:hypothetical protein